MTEQEVTQAAEHAVQAVAQFRRDGLSKREAFFETLANLLVESENDILAANQKDLDQAEANGVQGAMLDRLKLNPQRIADMAKGVREIAMQTDPLGRIEGKTLPNGLKLEKVSVGIGVVGFIYESRPNVTIDAAALCVKSGNAVLLKGGKEAVYSNMILESICRDSLNRVGLPADLVVLLDCTDRSVVSHLVKQVGKVDLVIPRGGKGLIKSVVEQSLVPVIKHYEGNCHLYVHESADLGQALELVLNAKTQRPGVCNAMESLLVDESILEAFLPNLEAALSEQKVEIRACEKSGAFLKHAKNADAEDWGKEYLDLVLSVKSVEGLNEAVDHISKYGSQHTDGIVARCLDACRRFAQEVDSSAVMINASTRFNDGSMFGLGAEIGISTDKLHARGPMGAGELTTWKYVVEGQGHVRV